MTHWKKKAVVLACATTIMGASPVEAQYGRLLPAGDLTSLFRRTCVDGIGTSAAKAARSAAAGRWDELGRGRNARPGDRGWLVSLSGQPAIVDVSRPGGSSETCSASAVTNPAEVVATMSRLRRRAPDYRRETPGGVRSGWSPSAGWPGAVEITIASGQAMARITFLTPAR